jgi:hypothetical protein
MRDGCFVLAAFPPLRQTLRNYSIVTPACFTMSLMLR